MIPAEDLPIIARKNKANRIFKAPYRHGVNYLRLTEIIRECADQLFQNSMNRVFNH